MFMKNKRAREPVKHGKQDIVLSRIGATTTATKNTFYEIQFAAFSSSAFPDDKKNYPINFSQKLQWHKRNRFAWIFSNWVKWTRILSRVLPKKLFSDSITSSFSVQCMGVDWSDFKHFKQTHYLIFRFHLPIDLTFLLNVNKNLFS